MFSHRKKKFKLTHVNSEYVNAINALYRESTNSHNIANQSRIPYFLLNKCVQCMFHVHLFSILFSIFALFGSDFLLFLFYDFIIVLSIFVYFIVAYNANIVLVEYMNLFIMSFAFVTLKSRIKRA